MYARVRVRACVLIQPCTCTCVHARFTSAFDSTLNSVALTDTCELVVIQRENIHVSGGAWLVVDRGLFLSTLFSSLRGDGRNYYSIYIFEIEIIFFG